MMSKKKRRKKSSESNNNLMATKSDKFYVTEKQKFQQTCQITNNRKSNRKICATKTIKDEISSHNKQMAKIKSGYGKGGILIKNIKK